MALPYGIVGSSSRRRPIGVMCPYFGRSELSTMWPVRMEVEEIERWQLYLFRFGVQMSDVFNVDVTTKMFLFMQYVPHHFVNLGWIRNSSSKENWMTHNQFKVLYNGANKHIDCIVAQRLTSWVNHPLLPLPSPSHDKYHNNFVP